MQSLSFSFIGDILQASDNLSRVINSYKRIIEGQVINGEVDTSVLPTTDGESHSSGTEFLLVKRPVSRLLPNCNA